MSTKQCYGRLLVLLLYFLPSALQADKLQLCHSMEIRSLQDLTQLQKCNIVVGYVEIFNIDFPPDAGTNYSTAVIEITDYLLVHRVHGLQSLQQLLPQLVLIRGAELLFDRYALVVYENRDLEELSLISLLRIQQGAVRIESNPVLCFAETINWIGLLKNSTLQHFKLKGNKSPNYCPVCTMSNALIVNSVYAHNTHCWNLQSYQREIAGHRSDCAKSDHCCNGNCLGDCSAEVCSLCASLSQNGKCVDSCSVPIFYQLNKRQCVRSNICQNQGFISHASECLESCPDNYQLVNNSCHPNCSGIFVINTAKDLNNLTDCTSIKGSLIIDLTDVKSQIVEKMQNMLKGLKEITGYLKVIHSPQLVSLNFLQSLDTIIGNDLIDQKYALFVVDNHHLEQIWRINQKVAILNGQMFFHLNPRLCYDKILELSESLKSTPKITIHDASPNSNGERVICGTNVHALNASIEDVTATEVRIKVEPFSSNDLNVIVGYSHHYKEAPVRNVTMYDGRHGCGYDKWIMDIAINQNVRHVIHNLKPNTQYAFFVKTISYTFYHNQLGAYSEINYFTTKPSKPDPVAKIYTYSSSRTEMVVHWWPPRISKGHISKYLLDYEAVGSTNKTSTENYVPLIQSNTIEKVCQCEFRDPYYSGTLPNDENYYNKEEVTYNDAIMDHLYHAAIKTNTTKKTSTASAKVYEDLVKNEKKKALDQQDTGIKDFLLKKPLPLCSNGETKNCTILEKFRGTVISGHQHSYKLKNLNPSVTYRIWIRACVDGPVNGCGPEKNITAVTVSKRLDEFMRHNQSRR